MIRSMLLLGAMLSVCQLSAWGQDNKKPAKTTLQDDAKLLASMKDWRAADVPATIGGKKEKTNLGVQFMFDQGKLSGNISFDAANNGLSLPFELVDNKGKRAVKVPGSTFLKIPGFQLDYTVAGDKLTLAKGKVAWDKIVIDFGAGVTLKGEK